MRTSDGVRLVAMLGAAFRQEVADETALQWAKDLEPFDLGDGLEAVELARKTQVFMPSDAEFLALVRDCRNMRIVSERPALPSELGCCEGKPFAHFYQVHADAEMKARVDALLQIPKQRGKDTVVREAFAKMAAGNL